MVDALRDGAAPRAVLADSEPESRDAFAGGMTFMRNWPDSYTALARTSVRGRYAVAPLPIFDGAGVAGVLGGANLVIDADASNPAGALALIDVLVAPSQQKRKLVAHSEPAVLVQTYRDRDVRRAVPFADELFRAVRQARPRPVSPAYVAISDAISRNVHDALSNPERVSAEQALAQAQDEIDAALASASQL